MTRWIVACAVASGGVMLLQGSAGATYELARAEGTACATCHVSVRPSTDTLNEMGRYYQARRTLVGAPGVTGPVASESAAVDGDRSATRVRTGAAVYAETCAACHGEQGEGTPLALPFVRRAVDDAARASLVLAVRAGVEGTPMPGFGDVLTDAELTAVVDHVVKLVEPR